MLACDPASSSTTPAPIPTIEPGHAANTPNASAAIASAPTLTRVGGTRIASRPASGATRIPVTPSAPNSPAVALPPWISPLATWNAIVDQNIEKLANDSAPTAQRRRSTGSRRTIAASDASSARYGSRSLGATAGSATRSTAASPTITPAATTNTPRQPITVASVPLAVRDSSTPVSSPLITAPTTRPRSSGRASPTANGTIICVSDEHSPTAALAAASSASDGAAANASSAHAAASAVVTITARRSRTSPSGTSSSIPAAYPSCVPTSADDTPDAVV